MKHILHSTFLVFFLTILIYSCKQDELTPSTKTNLTFDYYHTMTSDTIYRVSELNVTSTDDKILTNARIRIHTNLVDTMALDSTIFDGPWREAKNLYFGLHQRKTYSIYASLYTYDESGAKLDLKSGSITIDNKRYPKQIKISNITADMYPVNISNYQIQKTGIKSITSVTILGIPEYEEDRISSLRYVYYLKKDLYEESVSFNSDSIFLPTNDYHQEVSNDRRYHWQNYEFKIFYSYIENDFAYYDFFKWPLNIKQLYNNLKIIDDQPHTVRFEDEMGDLRSGLGIFSPTNISYTYQFVYEK